MFHSIKLKTILIVCSLFLFAATDVVFYLEKQTLTEKFYFSDSEDESPKEKESEKEEGYNKEKIVFKLSNLNHKKEDLKSYNFDFYYRDMISTHFPQRVAPPPECV